jgi:hypothetical protein
VNDQTDSQLVRSWAETRSEPAFAELVRRHVDFVYSAALRMVCDSHLANDVTQSVFVASRKTPLASPITGYYPVGCIAQHETLLHKPSAPKCAAAPASRKPPP